MEQERYPGNIRQYRRPLNINLGVIIFGAIFLYITICVCMYFFNSKHIRSYTVQVGTLSEEERAEILRVTLEADDVVLAGRVSRDIAAGKRAPGSVERSLSYQKFYPGQRTLHLDTSRLTPEEAAAAIAGLLGR